jgi:hypothetical protein
LLPFPEQQQQALRDAYITDGYVGLWPILFSNSGIGCQALREHPCRATVLSAVGNTLRMMA